MKKIVLTILVCLLSMLSRTAFAEDKEDKIAVDVRADFFSKYIWRGMALNKDPVLQPSVNVGYKQLTATLWGNLELTDIYDNKNQVTEIDYVIDWSDETGIKGISYSVGLAHYTFPNTNFEDTTEIYAGLNFDCFLNPSIKANFDVDEAEGIYLQFGLSHSVEQIAKIGNTLIGMEVKANLGWGNSSCNRYYCCVDGEHFNDLTLSAAFPIELPGDWSVIPSLNYATLVDREIRQANAYGDNHNLFAGVSLAKKF